MCESAARKVEGLGGDFVFTLPASWVAHTALKFMGSSLFPPSMHSEITPGSLGLWF